MRIPLRSLPIRAGYPSIYENGAPAGGSLATKSSLVSLPPFPQWKCRRDREPRVPCSPRALGRAPRDKSRSYRRSAHSRDPRCPANYYTLINRTRVFDLASLSPLFAVSHFLHFSISLFRVSSTPLPFLPRSSSALITLPPSASPPFLAPYTRTASVQFDSSRVSRIGSRPRSVDAASGERRTGVVRWVARHAATPDGRVRVGRKREKGKEKDDDPQSRQRYRQKPVVMILSALAKIGAKCWIVENSGARARARARFTSRDPFTCDMRRDRRRGLPATRCLPRRYRFRSMNAPSARPGISLTRFSPAWISIFESARVHTNSRTGIGDR